MAEKLYSQKNDNEAYDKLEQASDIILKADQHFDYAKKKEKFKQMLVNFSAKKDLCDEAKKIVKDAEDIGEEAEVESDLEEATMDYQEAINLFREANRTDMSIQTMKSATKEQPQSTKPTTTNDPMVVDTNKNTEEDKKVEPTIDQLINKQIEEDKKEEQSKEQTKEKAEGNDSRMRRRKRRKRKNKFLLS